MKQTSKIEKRTSFVFKKNGKKSFFGTTVDPTISTLTTISNGIKGN